MTSSSFLIAAALALGVATIATGHEHGDSRTLPANANTHGHNHEDDGGHMRSGSRSVDMADRASHREKDGITMIHPHHSKPLPANLIGDDDDMDSHKRKTKHAGERRDGGQSHGDGWPTTEHEHAGEKVEQRNNEEMRRKKANTRTSTSNRRKDGGEGWAHSPAAEEPTMDVAPVIDVDETPVEHYAELRVHQPDVTHRQTVVEQEPVEIEYAPIVVRHDPIIREESRPFAFRPPQ